MVITHLASVHKRFDVRIYHRLCESLRMFSIPTPSARCFFNIRKASNEVMSKSIISFIT